MSAKFPESKGLDLPKVAENILKYWQEHDIFEKSVTSREGQEPYVFFEGPPSANGLPGVHHVLARAIKDIFPRYKTMKGFQVKRKAGWDTHGLPIELGVEKELGITKEDIGKTISVEDYNNACRKAVMRYTDVWNDLTQKMGYWVDMEDPYITYEPKYMETVWWLLKEIYNKKLIYKGYTIQPYSPKAGTGLSSHELNQPGTYQDVTDTTVVAQFKANADTLPDFLQDEGDIYFLAWTTTPWTLPSNTALTVGPKIEYVLVETYNQYTFEPMNVVLAKNLVNNQFSGKFFEVMSKPELLDYKHGDKKIPFHVVKSFSGKDLVGITYEQLLPYALPNDHAENAFRVISGDFVTVDDGTGIVHTAPTFGADDALVAKQASPEIPPLLVKDEDGNLVPLVDLQGRFRKEVQDEIYGFAGEYVKSEYLSESELTSELKKQQESLESIISNLKSYMSVDERLALKLKNENKAFKVEKYKHSYPNCWRTDKPILYYPLDSWFIKVTDVKERMVELNKTINWKPESTGTGRFGNWLANANDWNLSRSRYWGIPLPIWRTEDGKEEICIGSVEELKHEMQKSVETAFMPSDIYADFEIGNNSEENYAKIDLHKNIVDAIILVSPSGKKMYREADLIDVWFDSGSMPYAQWHYPFQNKEKVEKIWRKADFIAEGVDQTRGWFYTLHAIATMIFDDVAYKNVVSNGLVLDKNGQKMSKRLGNAVDPFTTLDTYGADATRWYMISNTNPWDNLKFDLEGIEEVKRKFFGTLYNTYSFFTLYTNLDGFAYAEDDIPLNERPEIDRWILSELHTLIQKVDDYYADYEPTKAARAISDFTQDYLSNWYVRLSRRRFWKGDYQADKISAYQTLYTCMVTIAKLGAPIAPFFMDKLYLDLNSVTKKEDFESVHLAEFPKFDSAFVNKSLERKMENAQIISSLVLSLRAKEKIKVRQPLQKIMIPFDNDTQKEEILAVADLIKSEVNVKAIEVLEDEAGILVKQIKPNFKVLGPRFGADMKAVAQAVNNFGAKEIKIIEQNGSLEVQINGKSIILERGDVEITSQDIEGWLVASSGRLTVALDVTLTEALRKEGIARELVNRIQNLRKDSGFELTDRISVKFKTDEHIINAIDSNLEYIKTETLTDSLEVLEQLDEGIEIAFDEVNTKLFIEKI
ncbi:isoleucine--tRNA ligase [Subsaximicrobium wynnwilliamsii]|uniref:Isoleucine--tRNA ligase n=1 Tax=Subsaximicrobium wynnwilliamsii TaxID=291179 RepID=A0A5C6ZH22_9FLAO|nr:isoleucine--tRNA ligase [Subsaximicrobium wynnwilliamsii]TXD82532.1 isoleucine--tRNA ligase [Subsaximicrobium wynnwilliamsii]TXD88175.1 isoleucine--tRNA ligase [Subsaximicrobium wynnwilliamsii]TXE02190.1 isoleucine--tRNA ligase [Subsaximicrobium wynnwilliamsii]